MENSSLVRNGRGDTLNVELDDVSKDAKPDLGM